MQATQALQTKDKNQILEQVIAKGDLSQLTAGERMFYYNALCQSVGLNPLTRPFEYLLLNGKVVLYARKDATEQLRKINGVSIYKIEEKTEDEYLTVTAYARDKEGREDVDQGVISLKGAIGDQLCNLHMKCITKAKRRVTLSICGLGFLDESEIETIPGARRLEESEEGIMTDAEAEIVLSRKGSGLAQWTCERSTALRIVKACAALKRFDVSDENIKAILPKGVTSRKELTEEQAQEMAARLEGWLKNSHGVEPEVINGEVENG